MNFSLSTETTGRFCVYSQHVPDKYVDGFAVIGAEYNMEWTQKGLQDVDEANGHLLHLIKNEDRAATFRQVALHPVF